MSGVRVVVLGCGFGGLEAVRALSRAPVEITLVDRTNHHLFQPLLYQVATAGLSAPAVSAPIRHVLRREMRRGNLTVLKGDARDVDVGAREVVLDGGERIPYDHLIVAVGATHSWFGHDAWAEHAPGLKTLADAFALRARTIGAFENAERAMDAASRNAWLTFAVIGGGPTGVEMAGTLAEIARHTLRGEFRRIDPAAARVVLLEGAERILGAFVPALSARARAQLERLGVEVRTGARVTDIDAAGVTFESVIPPASDSPVSGSSSATPSGGRSAPSSPQTGGARAAAQAAGGGRAATAETTRLACRTVVWAAGVAGAPLGAAIARGTGATLDRAGRLAVEPDLTLPGHPEISVVGDLAAALSYAANDVATPVPGVSPAAKQMGRSAAANIVRRLRGESTRPFRYRDYGNLATVGRKAAIVDLPIPGLGALRFSGLPAWLFWLFAHIYFLIGFRNRLIVMVDWAWAYFTYERSARVVAEGAPARTP